MCSPLWIGYAGGQKDHGLHPIPKGQIEGWLGAYYIFKCKNGHICPHFCVVTFLHFWHNDPVIIKTYAKMVLEKNEKKLNNFWDENSLFFICHLR